MCEEQFAAGVARSGMRAVCMMLRRPSSTDSHSHRHIIMASSTLAQPARWPEAAASVSRAQHLDVSQGRIVLHLLGRGLRYFCVLPRSQSSRNRSTWFLSRMHIPTRRIDLRHATVLVSTDGRPPVIVSRDSSFSHNAVMKLIGTAYHAFGGQDWRPRGPRDPRDGVRHYILDGGSEARSFDRILGGGWSRLPHGNRSRVFDGSHAGCLERRSDKQGAGCEFDGKIGAVHIVATGRWHVFVRQNHKTRGGRYVAVSTSGERGPFGPLRQIRVQGYPAGRGNIYFAAVDRHPTDAEAMLGLFPVNEGETTAALKHRLRTSLFTGLGCKIGREDCGNCDGASYIGLSLSCDGVNWARLHPLISTQGREGRTDDHPVDGLLLSADGAQVHFWVHRAVEDIAPDWASNGRIVEHSIPVGGPAGLEAFTAAAKARLLGCSARRARARASVSPIAQ